jgi:hypothetical protein
MRDEAFRCICAVAADMSTEDSHNNFFKIENNLKRNRIESPPANSSGQQLKMSSLMAPPPVSNGTGLFIGAAAVVIIWFYAFSRGGYVSKDSFQ